MAKRGSLLGLLAQIDALLRPESPTTSLGESAPTARRLLGLVVGLGATYGFFMGWYALALHWGTGRPDGVLQLVAAVVKLPALFLCTLAVTFPSLYVFSALAGARLDLVATLRVLLSAIAINLAVAASLGTILGFFTLSTTSYPFMVVLNVVLLGISGVVGLGYLRRTLALLAFAPPPLAHAELVAAPIAPSAAVAREGAEPAPAALFPAAEHAPVQAAPPAVDVGRGAQGVFRIWTVIYALVGMQMGWLLRPFIGHPAAVFTLFRARTGNFFLGLFENLGRLFGP
jgi:hypothetical protein